MNRYLTLFALLFLFGLVLHVSAETRPVLCGERTFLVPIPAGFSEEPSESRVYTVEKKNQEGEGNDLLAYFKSPVHTVVNPETLFVYAPKSAVGVKVAADVFKDILRSKEFDVDAATATKELQDSLKGYKEK